MLLGHLLVQEKFVSPAQLEQILSEQNHRNQKLGELMVEKNIISPAQLEQLLEKQYWQKNGFWLIS
ncbi:hypothetical protein UH38_20575 [Aliterella atlantica CENA595]|uniref:Type II secretion system protein GspE N-terminal domain-containing protein n=2 Tax=Aliterella TaxID=1827277 RepID=A0A0D8ZNI7_9CYAN|nr:hypothetical protein UH38_20575 [Aliterella atlantica CENA595]